MPVVSPDSVVHPFLSDIALNARWRINDTMRGGRGGEGRGGGGGAGGGRRK